MIYQCFATVQQGIQWPYTYDSCDVGTAPNQTVSGRPETATVNGDQSMGGALSYLPGQRLSRCTCAGESHPGPVHADGTYVGRAAPEIDMFEALVRQVFPKSQLQELMDSIRSTGTCLSDKCRKPLSGLSVHNFLMEIMLIKFRSLSMKRTTGSITATPSSFLTHPFRSSMTTS